MADKGRALADRAGVPWVALGELVGCPECGGPAEVVDEFVLTATDGPIRHVKVQCLHRHWSVLPADRCPPAPLGGTTAG
jgi:hypothetical protein